MRWLLLLIVASGCGFKGPTTFGIDAPSNGGDDGPPLEASVADAVADAMPSGLIAWYEMESAPPALDSTGHGHIGTCASCPTEVPAKRGGGYQFNGVNRIDVVSTTDLQPATFTLACWTRWSTFPGNNIYACPLGKYYGGGFANSWQICLRGTDGSGGIEWVFISQHGAFDQLRNPAAISTGGWHHLAATWDGATKMMYLDGGALPLTSAPTMPVKYDTGLVTLGADILNTVSQDSAFDGVLDDVRIYDRALSASEIVQLAQP